MPTRQQWKFAEDRLAEFFGTVRRPLSGGASRSGGRDDGMHPVLYLESKYGKKVPLFPLYQDAKKKADAEGKVPVIGIQQAKRHGILLCIHSSDLKAVVIEWAKTHGFELKRKGSDGKVKGKRKRTSRVAES